MVPSANVTIHIRAPRLMDLDYNPALPESLLLELQRAAGQVGLPLLQLEALGQESRIARQFIQHVRIKDEDAFLATVEWDHLETLRRARNQRQASHRLRQSNRRRPATRTGS